MSGKDARKEARYWGKERRREEGETRGIKGTWKRNEEPREREERCTATERDKKGCNEGREVRERRGEEGETRRIRRTWKGTERRPRRRRATKRGREGGKEAKKMLRTRGTERSG